MTFADLPRNHQYELVRLACTALLSIAFFIGIGTRPRPIPSHRLPKYVLVPNVPPQAPNPRPGSRY